MIRAAYDSDCDYCGEEIAAGAALIGFAVGLLLLQVKA